MKTFIGAFLSDDSGTAAVEYGALVGFIGLSLVLLLEGIGLNIGEAVTSVKAAVASVFGGTAN